MLEQRIQQHLIDSADLKYQAAQALGPAAAAAVQALVACVTGGGKVLACGTGVAALQAQMFVALWVLGFEHERPALAAVALGHGLGMASGAPGDGANGLLARQVRALGQAGDVLLLIAQEGDDADLLAAVHAAHERDMAVLALTGREALPLTGQLRETDVVLAVPHERAARVREVHMALLHSLCGEVDNQLLGLGEQEDAE